VEGENYEKKGHMFRAFDLQSFRLFTLDYRCALNPSKIINASREGAISCKLSVRKKLMSDNARMKIKITKH